MRDIDSSASAEDIGTGEDFMTAWTTSLAGSVRRLRGEWVEDVALDGDAKYL